MTLDLVFRVFLFLEILPGKRQEQKRYLRGVGKSFILSQTSGKSCGIPNANNGIGFVYPGVSISGNFASCLQLKFSRKDAER